MKQYFHSPTVAPNIASSDRSGDGAAPQKQRSTTVTKEGYDLEILLINSGCLWDTDRNIVCFCLNWRPACPTCKTLLALNRCGMLKWVIGKYSYNFTYNF